MACYAQEQPCPLFQAGLVAPVRMQKIILRQELDASFFYSLLRVPDLLDKAGERLDSLLGFLLGGKPLHGKLTDLLSTKINVNKRAEIKFQRKGDKKAAQQTEVADTAKAGEAHDTAKGVSNAAEHKFKRETEQADLQLEIDINAAILDYKKTITAARAACPPPDIPERKKMLYAEILREKVSVAVIAFQTTMQKLETGAEADKGTWAIADKTHTRANALAGSTKTDSEALAEVAYWKTIDKEWPPPPA